MAWVWVAALLVSCGGGSPGTDTDLDAEVVSIDLGPEQVTTECPSDRPTVGDQCWKEQLTCDYLCWGHACYGAYHYCDCYNGHWRCDESCIDPCSFGKDVLEATQSDSPDVEILEISEIAVVADSDIYSLDSFKDNDATDDLAQDTAADCIFDIGEPICCMVDAGCPDGWTCLFVHLDNEVTAPGFGACVPSPPPGTCWLDNECGIGQRCIIDADNIESEPDCGYPVNFGYCATEMRVRIINLIFPHLVEYPRSWSGGQMRGLSATRGGDFFILA